MTDSKRAALRAHAKKRAQERYGLTLTTADLNEISRIIREMCAVLVVQQSQRVSVYKLDFRSVPVQVAYDWSRTSVITFLPYEMVPFTAEERAANRQRRAAALRGDTQDDGAYGPLGGR